MNSVTLVGTVATDPEMRYTKTGLAVTNFRIAVDTGRAGDDGKRYSDYFTVTAWTKLAEELGEHLNKGTLVAVQGRLTNEKWTDDGGKKRYQVKVVASSVMQINTETGGDSHERAGRDVDPDDIPF